MDYQRRADLRSDVAFWVGVSAATILAVWGLLKFADLLGDPYSGVGEGTLRPALLCASLVGLNVVSYVVWPSRWNIVAHTQLAFSLIAYVIPIFFLGRLDELTGTEVDLYFRVIIIGFALCLLGAPIGAAMANHVNVARLRSRANLDRPAKMNVVANRVFLVGLASIAAISLAFAVMGFIPALTPDPLVAKFFRGAYAEAYAPVAPLYRAGTSAIALLLPLIALFAFKRRSGGWLLVLTGSMTMLLLGLLREPAVSGLLLLLGVYFAIKGRGLPRYFALLVGAYFLGGALYYVLGVLGFGAFAVGAGARSNSLLAEVAAGAPDINDQLVFLRAWLRWPEYTNGLTFVGGLVPGNFEWNPSVWSLQVVNPSSSITSIASGGLRLPAPIWGLVSFGWSGVVAVSFFVGVVTGHLAQLGKKIIPSDSLEQSTVWLVLYVAAVEVFTAFYRLSYLSVLQLVLVAVIVFRREKADRRPASRRRPTPATRAPRSSQRLYQPPARGH